MPRCNYCGDMALAVKTEVKFQYKLKIIPFKDNSQNFSNINICLSVQRLKFISSIGTIMAEIIMKASFPWRLKQLQFSLL